MLPRVILHNVISVDGRMDWLTPDLGLYYELAARWNPGAVLVGADTMLSGFEAEGGVADESTETFETPPTRDPDDPRPLVVISDSRGRIRFWRQLQSQPYWREPIALCARSTPQEYLDYLARQHVRSIRAGQDRVDYRAALLELAELGVKTVRVDSGGTLNGVLLRAGLVDEVSLLLDPVLVGGLTPRSMYKAADLNSAGGVLKLRLLGLERLQNDIVWLRYQVIG